MFRKLYPVSIGLYLLITLQANSQDVIKPDTTNRESMYDLSLEDLMNISIVSASKKEESLFDAPLSASVLTKEEISKAGATSIMEALKLIPGLIVRQQTNGNYDIHIRGLDNIPPNTYQAVSGNSTTLVMINNRPVYNYIQGGTFWETLPVDLNDVEKIEVIRGASSTLYGTNAVSGVINIITRQPEQKGLNSVFNAQYGSLNTILTNASVGYQFSKKFSTTVSANYQGRGRDVSYYNALNGKFYNTPDSLVFTEKTSAQWFPHPDRAMDKYGVNLFAQYKPFEKVELNLTGGLQNSEVQNALGAYSVTGLTTATSRTSYIDAKAKISGLSAQLSYMGGKQVLIAGKSGNSYDFNTTDVTLEYEIKAIPTLFLKPGVSYRKAVYDDTPYWNAAKKEGLFNKRAVLDTYAASVRIDYKAFDDKVRLTGGIRIDKFNYPNKSYPSYQVAANYKPSSSHLVRVVYSRAYRSPFIIDTYVDQSARIPLVNTPGLPEGSYAELTISGNKKLEMLYSTMAELGYRGRIAENLSLDVETYYTTTQNYTNYIVGPSGITPDGNALVVSTTLTPKNLPVKAKQRGLSVSVNYVVGQFQIKPFITWQYTALVDYSKYSNDATASPSASNENDPEKNNYTSGIGTTLGHNFTPRVYGGAFINYQAGKKLNINLNPYYFSSQTFLETDNLTYNDGNRGVQHIAAKLILNAKINYSITPGLSSFITLKNILDNNGREYYKTDQLGRMFLVGISLKY